MTYQSVLPFDETYAWENLVKNLKKLSQGQKIVYYGITGRRISIRNISKDNYLVTSYSLGALTFNIEYDSKLSFVEVEFMSTVIKPIVKHIHSFKKGLTRNPDWRKQVYHCSDPDCSSYFQAHQINGKTALCAKCGTRTTVDYEQIRHRNRNLTCLQCSKSPKKLVVAKVHEEVQDIFDKMFEEQED